MGDVGVARTTQSQPHPHELELAEDVTHSPTPHSRCTAATIAPSPASATCRCPHSREPAGRPLHSLEQACWQRRHAHACTTLSPKCGHNRTTAGLRITQMIALMRASRQAAPQTRAGMLAGRHAHACTTLSLTLQHHRRPLHHADARTHAS